MEYHTLPKAEKKLLLSALDIKNPLRCRYCGHFTNIEKCGMAPDLKKEKATFILCDSIFCLMAYQSEVEDYEKSQHNWIKRWLRWRK